jgi:DegV family protein with EDD domain
MPQTAIVTDTTADLTPAQAAAAGVRVVPLLVRFGSDEWRAGVDMSTEEFWQRLLAPGAPLPTTSAPPPGAFQETFDGCFADGAEGVVCLTISAKLSGTHGSATVAAQAMPGREIHVIDTETTTGSQGIAALHAADLAAQGMGPAEVAAEMRARLADLDIYVAVDTLEYLRRGGRLSAARAAIGTVLSVKPIITIRDGEVVVAETTRTRSKARERVVDLAAAAPVERLAIVHTPASTPDEVAAFRDAVVARLPGGIDPGRVTEALIGASTGPHLGPGLMGAALLRRRA